MKPAMVVTIAILSVMLYLLHRVFLPTVDPRHPPVLQPKIPFFGHIISFVFEKTKMFERL
jgi:hypothetical protein